MTTPASRPVLLALAAAGGCGRDPCVTVPTTFPGVALDDNLFFIFRACINPGSSVSPGHEEPLTERMSHLRDAP